MTTRNTMTTPARNLTVLAVLAALPLACCDGGPLDPNTAGCTFDQAAVTEDVAAVLEITGGPAAADDEYVIRVDGAIRHVNRLSAVVEERSVPARCPYSWQQIMDRAVAWPPNA